VHSLAEKKPKQAAAADKTPVLLVPPYGKTLEAVVEKLKSDPTIEYVECRSPLEAPGLLLKNDFGLLICNTSEASELVKQVTMLKLLQQEAADHRVRTVVITSANQVSILSRLAFYGCSEIIQEPIQAKPLLFKIQRHVRALAQANKSRRRTRDRTHEAPSAEGLQAAAGADDARISYVSPLGIGSDFWVLPWNAAKWVGSRWEIRMMGPPPGAGLWTRVEGPEGQNRWCLRLSNSERSQWIPDPGDWYFRGDQPRFEDGFWIFAGPDPELAFVHESRVLGTKIATDRSGDAPGTGVLTLARNSPRAEKLEKTYIEQAKTAGAAAGPVENPIYVEPLFIESDCWLLHGKKPKEVGGRWVIKLKGPGSQCGRWEEIKNPASVTDGEDRLWRWAPAVPGNDPFIVEPGQWIFRGRAPKFEADGWLFISDRPELAFMNEGETLGAKIRMLPDEIVAVAQDSSTALAKLPLIESTMNLVKRMAGSAGVVDDLVHIKKDDGAKIPYGRGAGNADAEIRMPAELFGLPPGAWEEVLGPADVQPYYVYVPSVLLDSASKAPDVRTLEVYWCFVGVLPPRLDEAGEALEWVFKGEEPVPYHKFKALPPVVQQYLLNRFAHVDLPAELGGGAMDPAGGGSDSLLQIDIPVGPVLSPLTLAFLLSELEGRPGMERGELVRKACNYLSASCGGVRTELWVKPDGQEWRCAGSYDGTDGEFVGLIASVGAEPALLENGMVVVPVKVPRADYDAPPSGALLMAPGEGVQADVQFAAAVGRIFSGLVQGLV